MTKELIVGIAALLLLAGCCSDNDRDCTAYELEEKQAAINELKEQESGKPKLVSVQDGVKLYRIWTVEPQARAHWTYFTTPCGDVHATLEWTHGKGQHDDIPLDSAGSGCK